MNPFKIIKYPCGTEKAIRLMDSENKLVFYVDQKSKKSEIKKAIEEAYNVKIVKVCTMITTQGTKKAYVKLAPEDLAIDLATKLGMM
jgi:large subunit ribosomal protein L23